MKNLMFDYIDTDIADKDFLSLYPIKREREPIELHVVLYWGPEYIFKGFSEFEFTDKGKLLIYFGKKKISFPKKTEKSGFEFYVKGGRRW